ncbi:hypothetical protein C4D60_Mb04t38790 [Musa balbisiana]|uniref:Uncharacterized protein n=1 Tax=Musa balbisiana TaxID=52838 RepID=A0A4S8KHT8_MUSBA|nr:hypothetical protein C4D60_Mb04t38790 [Musa balbisiana]
MLPKERSVRVCCSPTQHVRWKFSSSSSSRHLTAENYRPLLSGLCRQRMHSAYIDSNPEKERDDSIHVVML